MILGFYYHIPVVVLKDKSIAVPVYLGKFIDSLAAEVSTLFLFMHVDESLQSQYQITSSNVILISLGKKPPAYIRYFFSNHFLSKIKSRIAECDQLLIRAPSPLAHAFTKFTSTSRITYLVVGSYKEGSKYLVQPWYKSWAIKLLNVQMHKHLEKVMKNGRIAVNSPLLYNEYKVLTNAIKLVYTTTLSIDEFSQRSDTCQNSNIKLLYIGRLDFAKGLKESIKSLAAIRKLILAKNVSLHIVGGEGTGKAVTEFLKQLAVEEGVENNVFFYDEVTNRERLLDFYRSSDIYLLPSYHEGFPRTIWEAFANCIPVVASRVGGIPAVLKDKENAMLIRPGSVSDIVEAVMEIMENNKLRTALIRNAYKRVEEVTVDVQTKRLMSFIKSEKS